jgi:hypothetical protein
MPYDKKPGAVTRMYDEKGKPTGLMMEGSVNHMGSLLHHSGKSKMHAKPEKEMPDDGHTHYEKVEGQKARKLVKSPDASETNKLSDTSGAVTQMSPYKFTGMSGGSAMHDEDPELQKAIAKREKIEMIRQKQQNAIEEKDRKINERRAKVIKLRKEKGFAPKKLTGSVEVGRIN